MLRKPLCKEFFAQMFKTFQADVYKLYEEF